MMQLELLGLKIIRAPSLSHLVLSLDASILPPLQKGFSHSTEVCCDYWQTL